MKIKHKLILSLLILIFIMSSFTAWSAPYTLFDDAIALSCNEIRGIHNEIHP